MLLDVVRTVHQLGGLVQFVATIAGSVPDLRHERLLFGPGHRHEVAAGFEADPSNDLTVTSLGLAWKPAPQVIWKLDYQIHSNAADRGVDQWNVALGWLF